MVGMARDMALKGAQYSADRLAAMEERGLQFEEAEIIPAAVIPEGVKVDDEIDMFDADGNLYKATVTAV